MRGKDGLRTEAIWFQSPCSQPLCHMPYCFYYNPQHILLFTSSPLLDSDLFAAASSVTITVPGKVCLLNTPSEFNYSSEIRQSINIWKQQNSHQLAFDYGQDQRFCLWRKCFCLFVYVRMTSRRLELEISRVKFKILIFTDSLIFTTDIVGRKLQSF